MSINTHLFQKIYDQITQHPETHDQKQFEWTAECGTTRCVAGWAVAIHHQADSIYCRALEGITINTPDLPVNPDSPEGTRWLSSTAVEAMNLLGLTPEQAHDLFYDTMDDGKAVAKVLRYATKGDEA